MENEKITAIERKYRRYKRLFFFFMILFAVLSVVVFVNEFLILDKNQTKLDFELNRNRIDQLQSDLNLANARVTPNEKDTLIHDKEELNSGIWFEVQIGAFKHFNLHSYKQGMNNFNHVAENDLDKYRLGAFKSYELANGFKKDIRRIGVKDAFIVVKKDGQNISIEEALEELKK